MTREEACELFEYRDGHLFWRVRRGSRAPIGGRVGSKNVSGYLTVGVNGKNRYCHRIVWLMFHGTEPELIDHINGKKDDNRIENLRLATKSQNAINTASLHSGNKSGSRGVHWSKQKGKWCASIRAHGKSRHLGFYETVDEAAEAYRAAEIEVFGEFARKHERRYDNRSTPPRPRRRRSSGGHRAAEHG